jgi:RNA polymerase sigma-B factor
MDKQRFHELFEAYSRLRECNPAGKAAIHLRNQLVVQNRPLAREIAHRFKDQCPEPYEDLEQMATIGLIKAVEKYDPSRGAAFSSFAVPYIQGEIQHALRDDYGSGPKVPRREIELSSRAKRLVNTLGVELDETVLARGLNVSAQKLRNAIEARNRKPVKSLDEVVHEPADEIPLERDHSWIKSHLAILPEPVQSVVIEHCLRGKSVTQIARQRKVPLVDVQEWLDQGLLKLKQRCEVTNGNTDSSP